MFALGASPFSANNTAQGPTPRVCCVCAVVHYIVLEGVPGVVWGVVLAVSVGHICCFMWCLSKVVLGNVTSLCLCISLYVSCLCGHASRPCVWLLHVVLRCGFSVRGDGACFTCAHTASGHRGPRGLRPLLTPPPRAPFWAVSCAMCQNVPSCLTLGMRCLGLCVCRCLCPFTLSSDHTWNGTVYRGVSCQGESLCVVNCSMRMYVRVTMCMMYVCVHLSVWLGDWGLLWVCPRVSGVIP